jgi:phosphate transport system substrate-binding protein
MKKITVVSLICSILLLTSASCTEVKRGEYAKGSGTVYCDEGFKPIMDEEIEVFEYNYPESSIIPFYVSESQAIDSLLADKTQSIVVTKELTKEQREYIKAKNKRIAKTNCIAIDAVALIANKNNTITTLSMSDIKDIMNGKITHWTQLGSNDTTAIKLVFDNAGSSTVSFMRDKFLPQGANIADYTNSYAQKSNADVFDIIKKDKSALGIISVSWLGEDLSVAKKVPMDKRMKDYSNQTDTIASNLTSEVNILKVSNPTEENDYTLIGYKPYQAYIYSGEYPLFRKVYMISTAPNSTVMHSFYTFITGFVGQKIISKTGILPYHVNPRVVEIK